MSLNLRETQTVPSTYDLLQTLVALRRDVMAEGDNLFGNGLTFEKKRVGRRGFQLHESTKVHGDLRPLQTALMCRGLSSLGRSESRVVPTLDAIIASLAVMLRVDTAEVPPYPSEETFFYGAQTIAREADAILGPGQHERDTRIMVTLPTEAAEDPSLIRMLVEQGH